MVVSELFKEAVNRKDILYVRIMLKDSLLIDRSFETFEELNRYASQKLLDLWVDDSTDTEVLSDAPQDLDILLVSLIDKFSKRRVNHLKRLIHKVYPDHQRVIGDKVIKQTIPIKFKLKQIYMNVQNLSDICLGLQRQERIHTGKLKDIRESVREIIRACAEIDELI